MNKAAIFAESAAVAHVEFRVRCETLSHGEDVVLVRSDDPNLASVSSRSRRCEVCCSAKTVLIFSISSVQQ
jgi:hypothetical protein